jgi:hypothetical protein
MYRDVAEAIISSPEWKRALKNCTKTQDGRETTPFRKLIQRMPGSYRGGGSKLRVVRPKENKRNCAP